MDHPDGWKDEEGDVDDHISKVQKDLDGRTPFFTNYPSNLNSAQPCGCDIGANHHCQWYPKCAFGRSQR